MASVEEICTMAMSLLKREAVNSIDDLTDEATQCKIMYPFALDTLLESYAWTFAIKRQTLSALSAAPINQYDFQYALPADCITPLELRADTWSGQGFTWIIEGQNVLSNADTVTLKYVYRVTQSGLFNPLFTMALAFGIAALLAYSMTGKPQYADVLEKKAHQLALRAQALDAQKGTQESFNQVDSWIKRSTSIFDDEIRNL